MTRPEPDGLPRWLKLAVIVLALLALLGLVAFLVGGGEHGPSRHSQSSCQTTEGETRCQNR
ncbi:MAG: hypothetical protein ACRDT6_06110 [Micromonosporaceae bacterium]